MYRLCSDAQTMARSDSTIELTSLNGAAYGTPTHDGISAWKADAIGAMRMPHLKDDKINEIFI